MRAARRRRAGSFINLTPARPWDVSPEEREAFWEKLYGEPGFGIWMGNFRDILTNEDANAAISAFIAKKIRERVKDPKVAVQADSQGSRLRHTPGTLGKRLFRSL